MNENRVIKFDSKERTLKKARSYVESLETFFDESEQAIPLLLKAMKLADRDFKREIMLILGSFAKEAVVWPLYAMMTDSSESEEIRHDAAIQLSVIGPFLENPQSLAGRLQEEIESSDAERRLHATFAMGWRGNSQAAVCLIERLYDSDDRVQQTAVNALCNLRDDRVLDLLLDRLNTGSLPQKRVILFNVWRFYSNKGKVSQVYLRYLDHADPDLRFDALVCMGPMAELREHVDVYRKCLKDSDSRIRELALKRIAEETRDSVLESLRVEIEALLADPSMQIKKAALKNLRKHKRVPDVGS